MRDSDHEPVLVRSKWGTNRYVYNTSSPVGVALIIGSLLFAGIMLYSLHAGSRWTEDDLRDAVYQAAGDLHGAADPNGELLSDSPLAGDSDYNPYAMYDQGLIQDAIEDTGIGASSGLVVQDAESGGSGYEVSTFDTESTYCIRLTHHDGELYAGAADGPC
ncbi:hypothetical protein [Streptomyces mesophilus]|uniref:hypothetical protein n=1 Tax=Streptomyces mesophilus TaxID=1775132 RepID=UPI0033293DAE